MLFTDHCSLTTAMQLAYIDTLPDVTVLLIHGWPLNSTMWWPQINGLEHTARIITPDLRGFGQSPTSAEPYHIGRYADDLLQLLAAIGHKEAVVLCGMSMGGYVALEFVRRYPQMVRGLILTATRAQPDDAAGRENRNEAIRRVRSHGVGAVTSTLPQKLLTASNLRQGKLLVSLREMLAANSADGVINALAAMRDRPDSRPLLPHITVPSIVIHGEQDALVPVQEAIDIADMLPNGEMVVLPSAGHLVNMEQPALWNEAAERFLARV